MHINSKAGIRTIKLTKPDQAALEKARAILTDMGLFCPAAKSADVALEAVLKRIEADGKYPTDMGPFCPTAKSADGIEADRAYSPEKPV